MMNMIRLIEIKFSIIVILIFNYTFSSPIHHQSICIPGQINFNLTLVRI
jgi:hypothetical protein